MILCVIIAVLIIWFMSTYNSLINSRVKVEEAFSTMDVYLKKRFDLIPNLVSIVQVYMDYEKDTYSRIVELRNSNISNSYQKIENEKEVSNLINTILAISEDYPDLKADTQFSELQSNLRDVEDGIEKSRRYYNATVRMLNLKVNSIPSNIVAKVTNIKEEPFFEIKNKIECENVDININK